jgi:hypothetical protein
MPVPSFLATLAVDHLALPGHLLAQASGGEGIIDWLTGKNAAVQSLARAIAVTFAILFVLYQAFLSRGALARIIVSGIAAAVFVWIVWNVTSLQDRVDQEVNAGRAPAAVSWTAGAP